MSHTKGIVELKSFSITKHASKNDTFLTWQVIYASINDLHIETAYITIFKSPEEYDLSYLEWRVTNVWPSFFSFSSWMESSLSSIVV